MFLGIDRLTYSRVNPVHRNLIDYTDRRISDRENCVGFVIECTKVSCKRHSRFHQGIKILSEAFSD